VNDSVFGPVNPLEPVHAAMDALDCDFWGIAESGTPVPHMHSIYLAFRPAALRHAEFRNFWSRVDANHGREQCIALYEIPLFAQLSLLGLAGASFLSWRSVPCFDQTPYIYTHWRHLLNHAGFPFIKRNLLTSNTSSIAVNGWEDALAARGYPVELIVDYLRRVAGK